MKRSSKISKVGMDRGTVNIFYIARVATISLTAPRGFDFVLKLSSFPPLDSYICIFASSIWTDPSIPIPTRPRSGVPLKHIFLAQHG